MFHPVKIFDSKGKVMKVISSEKLSKSYWEKFYNKERKNYPMINPKKKIPLKLTKIINEMFRNTSANKNGGIW